MPSSESQLKEPPPIDRTVKEWEENGYTFVRTETAPYDFRGTEWERYGQCGTSIYFAVCNGRGAMSWRVILKDYVNDPPEPGFTSCGLDWHFPPEMDRGFEGERDCDLLPGGKCRGDFGFSVAEPLEWLYSPGQDESMVYDWLRLTCDEEFPNV